jgi:L-ascorbate metabolism protein UlaG (beta-lactamase superfamily)
MVVKFLLIAVGVALAAVACAPVDRAAKSRDRAGFGDRVTSAPRSSDFLKWQWERFFKDIPKSDAYSFSHAENDPDFLQANRKRYTLTWIGHATVLLQMNGKNILTDPHFSRRASPFSWAGPARVTPPGLSMAELPPIDLVLISHDHYDSLDTQSILELLRRPGGEKTQFFVPLGLKELFTDLGVREVREFDWWDTHVLDGNEVTAVPAKHWSKRGLIGRNNTLWAGWVVRAGDFSFLFTGDSGYDPLFLEIGERLGPFDLSAIPIGAYEPRWFMHHHHIDPEEAVRVHRDVRSKLSVAIHWGTFILTDEPLDEPPVRLARARESSGIPPDEFRVLRHGETLILR